MNARTASLLRHMLSSLFIACLQIILVQPVHAAEDTPLIKNYTVEAISENSAFTGFSAATGERLYSSRHSGGKPDTPTCTSCHSTNPRQAGQTRAGKIIAPMALSRSPERYQDAEKVEKWFRRNCNSVLGRVCTAREKGDFLTFMMQQ